VKDKLIIEAQLAELAEFARRENIDIAEQLIESKNVNYHIPFLSDQLKTAYLAKERT